MLDGATMDGCYRIVTFEQEWSECEIIKTYCGLSNITGHRLDANIYHFNYRIDRTDALCDVVSIDLPRQIMTKLQMNKVISVVKS